MLLLLGHMEAGYSAVPPYEERSFPDSPPTPARPSRRGLLSGLPSRGRRTQDLPSVRPSWRGLLSDLPSWGRRFSDPPPFRAVGRWLHLGTCLPYEEERLSKPPPPGCYHPRFPLDAALLTPYRFHLPSSPPYALLLPSLVFSITWKGPVHS